MHLWRLRKELEGVGGAASGEVVGLGRLGKGQCSLYIFCNVLNSGLEARISYSRNV